MQPVATWWKIIGTSWTPRSLATPPSRSRCSTLRPRVAHMPAEEWWWTMCCHQGNSLRWIPWALISGLEITAHRWGRYSHHRRWHNIWGNRRIWVKCREIWVAWAWDSNSQCRLITVITVVDSKLNNICRTVLKTSEALLSNFTQVTPSRLTWWETAITLCLWCGQAPNSSSSTCSFRASLPAT